MVQSSPLSTCGGVISSCKSIVCWGCSEMVVWLSAALQCGLLVWQVRVIVSFFVPVFLSVM